VIGSFGRDDSPENDRALGRVRKLCLSLPETIETNSWGHPNFRAGKRTFVTYEWIRGGPTIAFRLSRNEVRRREKAKGFLSTPYGRGQWVSMEVRGRIDWRLVGALVLESYKQVAIKRMIRALEEGSRRTRALPANNRWRGP
jgi:predicted DNA-binding protein (MmcQ/YjbR family)